MYQIELFKDGKSEGRVGGEYGTRDEAEKIAARWVKAHGGIYDYRAMPVTSTNHATSQIG